MTQKETPITGYQYMDNMKYSGPYKFPNNKDGDHIHMPPQTTLKVPPEAKEGFDLYFDESMDDWVYVEIPVVKSEPVEAASEGTSDGN